MQARQRSCHLILNWPDFELVITSLSIALLCHDQVHSLVKYCIENFSQILIKQKQALKEHTGSVNSFDKENSTNNY